jgi:hypothetical protein
LSTPAAVSPGVAEGDASGAVVAASGLAGAVLVASGLGLAGLVADGLLLADGLLPAETADA